MSLSTVVALMLLSQSPSTSTFSLNRSSRTERQYVGDLAEIKKRGVLRVLTRNNSSSYFISRGRQLGFEYELAKAFADSLGVRLSIVVPKSRAELIPALLRGDGDLIAAGMTATERRKKLVRFSDETFSAQRVLVTHRHIVKVVEEPRDLVQLKLALHRQSTTFAMAKRLGDELGVALRVEDVSPRVEMEEILRRIERGEYEATIVDENVLSLEIASGVDVGARFSVGVPLRKAWGTRPKSVELAQRVDEFIAQSRESKLLNILYQRYFSPQRRGFRKAKELRFRADAKGRISPYDHLFRKEGQRWGIDWRLLVSLAYTESRFEPEAQSAFGAVGLMQVLPSTARKHGGLVGTEAEIIKQLTVPAVNVRVGSRYLAWLIRRFQNEAISSKQSIYFALAAYNVGLGHVKDSRALARRVGLDDSLWFKHVERAIRLKKDPRWYAHTRYGYCRAEQPIAYVSRVESRYRAYARHVSFQP